VTEPRRLPTIDPPAESESLQAYGCRVLRFVIEHDCTATLSDRDLELADHFYPLAIAAPELSARVLERIANARRLILAALRGRVPIAPVVPPAAKHDDRPDDGPMAPLRDAPIVRPPAGDRLQAPIDLRF
jgi:hypothetical protein